MRSLIIEKVNFENLKLQFVYTKLLIIYSIFLKEMFASKHLTTFLNFE